MNDLTLGVDVSDVIAPLAVVRDGEVLSRGIVTSNKPAAIAEHRIGVWRIKSGDRSRVADQVNGDIMFDAIRTETTRRLPPQQVDQVRVVMSTLGDDAVAIGAALASARA